MQQGNPEVSKDAHTECLQAADTMTRRSWNNGRCLGEHLVLHTALAEADHSLAFTYRQAKVALKCGSEEELLKIAAAAKAKNLCVRDIRDA